MNQDEITHQYDQIADDFTSIIEEGNKASREAFQAILPSISGKEVLDLGCGDGTDCAFYTKQGASAAHGIDASKELLAKARQRHPQINFQYGLFEKIPFEDSKFDFVFSKYALMTSSELDPIFTEVHRVLKPGGTFMFLVTHPIRQFYEKKQREKDYFKKEVVDSVCFGGKITFREPSHTLKEYFSSFMLNNFILEDYDERFDPAAEKITDIYPGFILLKWTKR